jgi:hypothetical protein
LHEDYVTVIRISIAMLINFLACSNVQRSGASRSRGWVSKPLSLVFGGLWPLWWAFWTLEFSLSSRSRGALPGEHHFHRRRRTNLHVLLRGASCKPWWSKSVTSLAPPAWGCGRRLPTLAACRRTMVDFARLASAWRAPSRMHSRFLLLAFLVVCFSQGIRIVSLPAVPRQLLQRALYAQECGLALEPAVSLSMPPRCPLRFFERKRFSLASNVSLHRHRPHVPLSIAYPARAVAQPAWLPPSAIAADWRRGQAVLARTRGMGAGLARAGEAGAPCLRVGHDIVWRNRAQGAASQARPVPT